MSLRCPAESGIVPFEPVTNRRMETPIAEVKTNTARARLASRLVRDCRDTACARSSFQPGNADPIPHVETGTASGRATGTKGRIVTEGRGQWESGSEQADQHLDWWGSGR